jgi:hypothetical protein
VTRGTFGEELALTLYPDFNCSAWPDLAGNGRDSSLISLQLGRIAFQSENFHFSIENILLLINDGTRC